MNLITIKPARKTKKSPKKKLSDTQKAFDRYWRKAQKTQQQIESLNDQLLHFKKRFESEILPSERRLNDQLRAETYHLMSFLGRKSLTQRERNTLAKWIEENIEALMMCPFYPQDDKEKISADYMALVREFLMPELFDGEEDNDGEIEDIFSEQDENEENEMDEEDFDEFLNDMFGEDYTAHFEAERALSEQKEKAADNIFKSTSLSTMFRRIARVLHPDLETDPVKKDEKHHLMSELIKARDNKDIITLFQMQQKYIGEQAADMNDKEMMQLIDLLKHRIHKLEEEKTQIIYQTPENAALYAFFSGQSDKQIANSIAERNRDLKRCVENSQMLTREISNLKKLKPFLEERYAHEFEEPDYYF